MARSRRLFAAVLSVILSLVFTLQTDMTVRAAGSSDYLQDLRGGVAALLNPGAANSTEIVNAQAKQWNLDFSKEEKEEEEENFENLVMVNVKKVLNVRSEARDDAEKIGKIYKDGGGTILERKDGWTKLQSGNVIGWASDAYLLFDEEAVALAKDVGKTVATIEAETLRVRQKPEPDAEVLGLLPGGEIVDVLEQDRENGWICIDYSGKEGYVSAEFVSLKFTIDVGETMEEYKARLKAEKEAARNVNYGAYTADADTTLLLAALIHCEAGGEPYEGQVAVGAVVMNRVRSSAYPDTIHGVIYASGQFTPAMSGKVNRVLESGKIYESCIKAAEEALSGVSNVGDLTHFRRVNGREGLVIGNHVFY